MNKFLICILLSFVIGCSKIDPANEVKCKMERDQLILENKQLTSQRAQLKLNVATEVKNKTSAKESELSAQIASYNQKTFQMEIDDQKFRSRIRMLVGISMAGIVSLLVIINIILFKRFNPSRKKIYEE